MFTNPSKTMHDPNLREAQRLLTYLQKQAVDSQNIPITSEELTTLANSLITRLIIQAPLLDEIIQEELDNLRYQIHWHKPNKVNRTHIEPIHSVFPTAQQKQ